MADRSVKVILSAQVDRYVAAMARAKTATEQVGQAAKSQQWADASTKLMAVGTAAAVGLGAAAKAAIEWEAQFAGVRKTVDGTTGQMADLEKQLRSMATSMPATHQEIAATAEAAGQLGIARDDVAAFTKTMVQLGETTNLTADQAATQLAQMMNIMQSAPESVDRLGATLVALGNNGASTEADILALSQRLAGVGHQMGLTEADVMGIANAMSSVGIEAEAGGTAMSMTLKQVDAAVRNGGKNLETYAKVSGLTANQFAQAWRTKPAAALNQFIEGLARVQAEGGDVNAVLEELGMEGIRQTDTLIRLAGAGDLLGNSLSLAGRAYQQNSALADEYGKRVETAAAQLKIAWNSIKDAAISVGQSMLPVVSSVAQGVASITTAVSQLPAPVLEAVAGFGGFVAAVGLIGGGAMKAVTAVQAFHEQLDALGPRATQAAGALGKITIAAAALSAAYAIANVVGSQMQADLDKQMLTADQAAQAMERLASTGELSAATMRSFAAASRTDVENFENLSDAVFRLQANQGVIRWAETTAAHLVGMKGSIEQTEEQFDQLDKALVSMDQAKAGRAFHEMAVDTRIAGASMDELVNQFGDYRASLEATADALGVHNLGEMEMRAWMEGTVPAAVAAAQAEQQLGRAHVDAGASAQEQADALQNLLTAMHEQANAALAASNAEIAYHQALADAAEVAAQGGAAVDAMTGRFDLNSQAGRQAQSAIDGVASAAWRQIDAMQANGASLEQVTAFTQSARQSFIDTAVSMGMTADQAAALANSYGLIPGQVVTNVSAPGADAAKAQTDAFQAALASLPPEKRSEIKSVFDSSGTAAAMAALSQIQNKTVYVTTVLRQYAESQGAVGPGSTKGGVTLDAFGGRIWGPGTETSDSVPAMLSRNEYVIKASSARAIGYDRLAWMNQHGELPRFASGGRVSDGFTRSVASDSAAAMTRSERVTREIATVNQHVEVHGADPQQVLRHAGRELERVMT